MCYKEYRLKSDNGNRSAIDDDGGDSTNLLSAASFSAYRRLPRKPPVGAIGTTTDHCSVLAMNVE
jgi:hypothetical protein